MKQTSHISAYYLNRMRQRIELRKRLAKVAAIHKQAAQDKEQGIYNPWPFAAESVYFYAYLDVNRRSRK